MADALLGWLYCLVILGIGIFVITCWPELLAVPFALIGIMNGGQ